MAQAHVYVRVQFTGTDKQVMAIKATADALRAAVEDAGGEFRGDAAVSLDVVEPVADPVEPVAEPVVEPVSEPAA